MIKNYKKIISKIFYVSKISKSTNKKLSTLVVVLLANFSALLDVIIILSIAFIFSDNISDNKYIAEYLSFYEKNQYFLIVIVFLRFVTLFFQKIYTKKIELVVDNDIKKNKIKINTGIIAIILTPTDIPKYIKEDFVLLSTLIFFIPTNIKSRTKGSGLGFWIK